jgi:hypothetical protein
MRRTTPSRETLVAVGFASLLVLLSASTALAERNVIRVENGITVEEETAPGRALPIMIGKARMKASAERIAAWVTAVHTYVDWQHNCEEARVLRGPHGSRFTYNRIGSPWPVSDRDVVLRTTRKTLEGGGILLEFRSTQEADFPAVGGVVRMPRLFGSYRLEPDGNGGTEVVYTVDSDPGGSLPAWLVRQAGKDLPYFTLRNLRARVESGPPPTE